MSGFNFRFVHVPILSSFIQSFRSENSLKMRCLHDKLQLYVVICIFNVSVVEQETQTAGKIRCCIEKSEQTNDGTVDRLSPMINKRKTWKIDVHHCNWFRDCCAEKKERVLVGDGSFWQYYFWHFNCRLQAENRNMTMPSLNSNYWSTTTKFILYHSLCHCLHR